MPIRYWPLREQHSNAVSTTVGAASFLKFFIKTPPPAYTTVSACRHNRGDVFSWSYDYLSQVQVEEGTTLPARHDSPSGVSGGEPSYPQLLGS